MSNDPTEMRIKRTARKIFFGEGRFSARMHEIARAADLNRALLHYYFRNRENLFEVVLKEALDESFVKMFAILSTAEPFETRVTNAIHHILDYLAEFPFIESFIISELNQRPDKAGSLSPINSGKAFIRKFLKEVKSYLKENKLPAIPPEHFVVNMMALCAYPSNTKPIIQGILGYDEKAFAAFLKTRKKLLPDIVLMKNKTARRN